MPANDTWDLTRRLKGLRQVGPETIDRPHVHRKTVGQELLNRYRLERDDFLKNIATGDESWVHHYDPENKRQSMEYRHPGSPSVKKFKTVPSAKTVMLTVFWDARGVLCTELLTEGSTVNSDRYCATLRSVKQRICAIRRERNTSLFHHDNARPHCSAQTQDAMTSLKFTAVPHLPYSPDLAPSDFWLFPKLKVTLKGQHFSSDAEVEAAVRKWISSQPETFFMGGMNKWIEGLKKMCSRKW
jgi:histone-lysine N-methyltransferase SETMAR